MRCANRATGTATDTGTAFDFRAPFAAARTRRKCPQGNAHDARQFVARTGMCVQRTPECSRGLAQLYRASAASGVHFFWLLFFVQAKKSDPLAGSERKAEWTRQQEQSKSWIPAFAGMTSK
jgi:hypothetical protein